MKPDETIERKLEELAGAVGGRDSFADDVMGRIKDSPVQFGKKQETNIVLRRILMRNVRFAAAAVIVIAAVLALTVIDKTVPLTYALEQTVKACHSVQFIHVRKIMPGHDEAVMVWAEFFEDGQPKSIRLSMPASASGEDGEKEVIWKDNVAQVWFKEKNGLLRVHERGLAEEILTAAREYDPKTLTQNLLQKQDAGKCEILIESSSNKNEPVMVTATALPEREKRMLLFVDQATQLPVKVENYWLRNGQYVLQETLEFHNYNQQIAASMFEFQDLPADITFVDQVTNTVGLEQGAMTDDEAALEVVRRFWQAVIDGEWATAGQMYDGLPAERIRSAFEEKMAVKTVRILSVGPVQPHPKPETRGVIVPCVLEITQSDGQTVRVPFEHIGVRQVYNQPGRWTIFGGL